jgi:phosphoglycerate dehydrogenase-like enzyme
MPRVLIASYPIRNQPGPFRDLLTGAGLTPVEIEGEGALREDQLREALPTVEAVLAGGEVLSADLLARSPGLRVIARTGVGYDAVDVAAATRQGIVVTITPGTNHGSVAEQTFALLLALSRNVVANDQTIRAGGWCRDLVQPIRGRTLGLVGLGRIGCAVAERARAFGMIVVAHDPLPPTDFATQCGVELVDFDALLARSDVVSLHLPLVPETAGLIHRGTLARMKPGALLLNTARGGLVVEADLHDALTSGRLAGAGLDVLNREPPAPDNPLLALPNVVFSPHVGGIDTQGMQEMATMAARCVVDLHAGRWPAACVVNAGLRDGWRW